jgi:hypothetical protein
VGRSIVADVILGKVEVRLRCALSNQPYPQLINQEVDSRRGVTLDEVLALIQGGVSGSI